MKYLVFAGVAGTALVLSLAACKEIEGVNYLRPGHPADPGAQAGRAAPMSRALVPENITVRPKLQTAGSRARSSGGSPASGMDHSMHRGSH